MTTSDQDLRSKRLVLYEEDVDRINRCLEEFLKLSGAKSALLIDKDGHMVTHQGDFQGVDADTVSALVAGSFSATQLMAQLLGESEFRSLYHQGKSEHLLIYLVGDRALLTVLFDHATTLGMVRLYAGEAAERLAGHFGGASANAPKASEGEDLDPEFHASAESKIDEILGGDA